jgi:hypothetical protein
VSGLVCVHFALRICVYATPSTTRELIASSIRQHGPYRQNIALAVLPTKSCSRELAAPRILVCSGKGRASGWKGSFRLLRSTAPPKPVRLSNQRRQPFCCQSLHHFNDLEERSGFRRHTIASARSLSVSDEEAFPSPAILSGAGRSGSRDARFEVSISQSMQGLKVKCPD